MTLAQCIANALNKPLEQMHQSDIIDALGREVEFLSPINSFAVGSWRAWQSVEANVRLSLKENRGTV